MPLIGTSTTETNGNDDVATFFLFFRGFCLTPVARFDVAHIFVVCFVREERRADIITIQKMLIN